ncbi:hypothetical protein TNCV_4350711 [Trichonephila clavipes]|nr:hypothetical protein TNCV_4350711 [Trichonephila clavipes]
MSYVKAVTPKCLGGPPVDRDRLNAYPGFKYSSNRKSDREVGGRPLTTSRGVLPQNREAKSYCQLHGVQSYG